VGFHLCIRLELKFGIDLNSKLNGRENRKKRKEKLTLYTWAEFGLLGPPISAAFPFAGSMRAQHPLAGGAHPSVTQLARISLVLSRVAESASASTRAVVPLPVGHLDRVVFPNRMRLARTSNADRSSVIYGSSPQGSSFGFPPYGLRRGAYKPKFSTPPSPSIRPEHLHRAEG
jgi:hypothetical protein